MEICYLVLLDIICVNLPAKMLLKIDTVCHTVQPNRTLYRIRHIRDGQREVLLKAMTHDATNLMRFVS